MKKANKPLISQIGGLLVVVCFFLPWVSCANEEPQSGLDLGGFAWVILAAGAAIAGSVHYFNAAGEASRARPVVVSAAVIAAALSLLRLFQARNEPFGLLVQVEYGGVGVLAGLLVSIYGALFLRDEET